MWLPVMVMSYPCACGDMAPSIEPPVTEKRLVSEQR